MLKVLQHQWLNPESLTGDKVDHDIYRVKVDSGKWLPMVNVLESTLEYTGHKVRLTSTPA